MEQNNTPTDAAPQGPVELGSPTGGVDLMGRPLLVGDVVILHTSEVAVYTIRTAKPVLHPGAPAHANHLVLLSQLDPMVAPGSNVVPVIKISSGPQLRAERQAAGTAAPGPGSRLIQP